MMVIQILPALVLFFEDAIMTDSDFRANDMWLEGRNLRLRKEEKRTESNLGHKLSAFEIGRVN